MSLKYKTELTLNMRYLNFILFVESGTDLVSLIPLIMLNYICKFITFKPFIKNMAYVEEKLTLCLCCTCIIFRAFMRIVRSGLKVSTLTLMNRSR